MLHLNKYLKELGLNENSFPFKKEEGDDRYLPDKDGFIDAEFFNLDYTLSLEIYSRLCYFRDNCLVGHPGYFEAKYNCNSDQAMKKWKEKIDSMIEAFRLLIVEDETWDRTNYKTDEEQEYASKNREKKIKKGLRNFIKYYRELWW